MNAPLIGSQDETVAFVPSGREALCLIETRPPGEANGITVVLLHGGGANTSLQRNQLWVRMARRLAASGFTAVRFDNHGVGDSTGSIEEFRLDQPFTDDLDAVLEWMRDRGSSQFALVGTCIGARAGLAVAARSDDVAGVALMMMPLRDYDKNDKYEAFTVAAAQEASVARLLRGGARWSRLKKLANAREREIHLRALRAKGRALMHRDREPVASAWLSSDVETGLSKLAARRVPVLMCYGENDLHYRDLNAARSARAGILAGALPPAIELRTLTAECDLSGFPTLSAQANIIEIVVEWLAAQVHTQPAADAPG